MPKKLAYHCSVILNDLIYIHGGFEYPDIPNNETFVLNTLTKKWRVINTKHECDRPPIHHKTVCTVWKGTNFVVPTFDTRSMETCTAILNLETETWTTLKDDGRKYVVGGHIMK